MNSTEKDRTLGVVEENATEALRLTLSRNGTSAGQIVSAGIGKLLALPEEKKYWKGVSEDDKSMIRAKDIENRVSGRGNKPAFLPVYAQKVIYALAAALSDDRESEDILAKMESPTTAPRITRKVMIKDLSRVIFGSANEENRTLVLRGLLTAAATPQIFHYTHNGQRRVRVSSLIEYDSATTDDIAEAEITFSTIFFENLIRRYAFFPPNTFEVWRKNNTMIFAILFDYLMGEYWKQYSAAKVAREKVLRDARKMKRELGITISEEELRKRQDDAARDALTITRKADFIKRIIGASATNYTKSREQKKRFWADFDRAVADLKELGIIEDGGKVEGIDQIFFVFSEAQGRRAEREMKKQVR